MLSPPPFFKKRKEFLAISAILIAIIALRLFFIYGDYKKLKNLNGYYYTDAQVLKLYEGKGKKRDATLLKLKSDNGLQFYLYTYKTPPKRFEWVRVKLKLKKNTTYWDYLKGFFAYGDIIENIENGFDAKAFLRRQIDKQHPIDGKINTFYHAIFLADPLDRGLREKISSLGISHLVAISGFHLGIMWLIIFGFAYIPYRFLQQKYFPWRNRNIDLGFFTLLFLLFFVLFVGAPPALVRSYVMLAIAWFVLILGLELISFQFLVFAMLLILAIAPKLIASLGLLLSFAGVFYIFLVIKWLRSYLGWFITLIAIPVGIFLLMFPIGHFFFGNSSIWQLMSPPLSVLFIIFYPVSAMLHLFGFGGVFDKALYALFNLPSKSITVAMPLPVIISYAALSFWAVFNKKAFWATLIYAAIITAWYMGIYLLNT